LPIGSAPPDVGFAATVDRDRVSAGLAQVATVLESSAIWGHFGNKGGLEHAMRVLRTDSKRKCATRGEAIADDVRRALPIHCHPLDAVGAITAKVSTVKKLRAIGRHLSDPPIPISGTRVIERDIGSQ
jgi:hypothetical protein